MGGEFIKKMPKYKLRVSNLFSAIEAFQEETHHWMHLSNIKLNYVTLIVISCIINIWH